MTTALTVVEPTSRPTMYLRSRGPPQSQASCLTLSNTRGLGLIPLLRSRSLTVTSTSTLLLLLQQPLDHAGIVVAETDNVVQRGEAVRLAGFLHFVQLAHFEFRILDGAPV